MHIPNNGRLHYEDKDMHEPSIEILQGQPPTC
jgi:hypothetical protein